MRRLGMRWDCYTYTAAILGQPDTLKKIELWYQLAQEENIVPTYIAASEVLKACLACRDGATAMNVLNHLWGNEGEKKSEKKGESALYSRTLSNPLSEESSAETGNNYPSSALPPSQLLRREDAPPPTPASLSPVGSLVSRASGDLQSPNSTGTPLQPDAHMCILALLTLKQEGKVDECLALINTMRDKGLEPSPEVYLIVTNALEKACEWRKAVSLLLQITLRGSKLDLRVLNAVINTCAKVGEYGVIVKLLQELPVLSSHRFAPTPTTCAQFIHACYKTKDAEKALECLDYMHSKGFIPSIASVTHVNTLLELRHRFTDTARVFEKFVAEHLNPALYDSRENCLRMPDSRESSTRTDPKFSSLPTAAYRRGQSAGTGTGSGSGSGSEGANSSGNGGGAKGISSESSNDGDVFGTTMATSY